MRTVALLTAMLILLASLSGCKNFGTRDKNTPKLLNPTYSGLPPPQQQFRSKELAKVNDYLLTALIASDLAYSDESLEGWTRTVLPRPSIGSKETSTVYISRSDDKNKTIDIAIRGTANIDDAYVDIQTSKKLDDNTGTSFHSGFKLIAGFVYKSVKEQYGEKIDQGYMIRLYGHSLGGAVASIVSMYLHEAGATIEFVGTFGAPRFTNNEGARRYQILNIVTYRVVRCDMPSHSCPHQT
ncbi:lipase family protein [Pseudomonas sp. D1-2]|uniref:lipase family protein n=1 Tax=unclassified Pseudomonas TaxID=196821 RepID=UPI003DA865C3